MSNALTIYEKIDNPVEAAMEMGLMLSASGMMGIPNQEAGAIVALTCMCEGMDLMEFGRTYHIVQGRPSMRADAMLAKFRALGGKHEVVQRDSECATVKLTCSDGSCGTFSLSWDEAKNEDFTKAKDGEGIKENYAYPRKRMQMLWARVISDGVRTLMPEIVAGVYTPEEMEDSIPAVVVPNPAATDKPAPPTADELLAQHSAQQAMEQSPPAEARTVQATATPVVDEKPQAPQISEADALEIDSLFGVLVQMGMSEQDKQESLESMRCGRPGAANAGLLDQEQGDELLDKLRTRVAQLQGKAI